MPQLPRTEISPDELKRRHDLALRVRRLRDLKELLGSIAWTEYVLPEIRDRMRLMGERTIWRPGSGLSSCEAIALGCARNGGAHDALTGLLAVLDSWVRSGESAADELGKLQRGRR